MGIISRQKHRIITTERKNNQCSMQFEPIFDYGTTDLTIDKNLVCWRFAELIKTLITLASDGNRQIEIIGFGAVCEEMMEDLRSYFTIADPAYLNYNLLSANQVEALKALQALFDKQLQDPTSDFWTMIC